MGLYDSGRNDMIIILNLELNIIEPIFSRLSLLDYLNLHYDIFGLLHDIPASCCLFFLISFISSDT